MSDARTNVLTTAWAWSRRSTLLITLWRAGRSVMRPNREAFARIDRAELPKPVDDVIRTTVARTRLWRDEREQIARELIAHAQDALDAGRTPGQIVESFGDPRRVARLMRRSMKRKRPVTWKCYRLTQRAVGASVLLLILAYGAIAVRFYTSEPSIRVDYGAVLDQHDAGYREDQKSWSVLGPGSLAWRKIERKLIDGQMERELRELSEGDAEPQEPGIFLIPHLGQAHADYDSVARAVRGFEPTLAEVRRAAARPVVGLPIGYTPVKVEHDGAELIADVVPAEPGEFKDRSLIEVQYIHLGPIRRLSQVLAFDARLAMDEGDTGRAVEDYVAACGLASQVRREPYLISDLIGIAIHQMVMREIERQLQTRPGCFDAEQFAALAHAHAELMALPGYDFEDERMVFLDTLQRVYSDNGDGDGRLTPAGLEYFGQLMQGPQDLGESSFSDRHTMDRRVRALTVPMSIVFSASRAEERAMYERVLDRARLALERGPAWVSVVDDHEVELAKARTESNPVRYSAAGVMAPALGQAVQEWFAYRQIGEAFGVMLALESWRLQRGDLPEDLESLTPLKLPAIPEDRMNPGSRIGYRIEGDRFVLYSVGSDGDDDGARPVEHDGIGGRWRDEALFTVRFPRATDPASGERGIGPDGRPRLGAPEGPDGDWILFDTRVAERRGEEGSGD